MKRWWIMSFIIPLPFLLAGIISLTSESFNEAGINNSTIAVIMFVGYGIGVFMSLMKYDEAGMLDNPNVKSSVKK